MTDSHLFHTPAGRFVSGSMTEKRTVGHNGKPIELEKQTFDFGIAIQKDAPGLGEMFQGIAAFAKQGYSTAPHIQQRVDLWFQTMSGFSMKITDGDKPNTQGQINDNMKGCFILWFSTMGAVIAADAQNTQIDINTIKRGWYVDVAGAIRVNGLTDHNAGIYMNPRCVRMLGEGDEILGGLTVEAALENAPTAPTALPAGARPIGSTPVAPATSGAPGTGMPGSAVPNAPATPLPGNTGQVAPGGLPGGAAVPGGTASPTSQHPAHPGILATGLPGTG